MLNSYSILASHVQRMNAMLTSRIVFVRKRSSKRELYEFLVMSHKES